MVDNIMKSKIGALTSLLH